MNHSLDYADNAEKIKEIWKLCELDGFLLRWLHIMHDEQIMACLANGLQLSLFLPWNECYISLLKGIQFLLAKFITNLPYIHSVLIIVNKMEYYGW